MEEKQLEGFQKKTRSVCFIIDLDELYWQCPILVQTPIENGERSVYKKKFLIRLERTGEIEMSSQMSQHRLCCLLVCSSLWLSLEKSCFWRWPSRWFLQHSNVCSFLLISLRCLLSWSLLIFWALSVICFQVVLGSCQVEQQQGSAHLLS